MNKRSYAVVARQLEGLGGGVFDIGIKRSDGLMMNRTWDAATIMKSLGWLSKCNASGAAIYIRPSEGRGLILIDDLTSTAIKKMKDAGLAACVVVETSPMNYQAWINLGTGAIDSRLATLVSREMALAYGGDLNSADWRHYGRLAGFTNRKPQYVREDGTYPFVLLDKSKHLPIPSKVASYWIGRSISRWLSRSIAELRTLQRNDSQAAGVSESSPETKPDIFYRSQLARLMKRYGSTLKRDGGTLDASKADWMISCKMLKAGYSKEQVRLALELESPRLTERKAEHASTYIGLTVDEAVKAVIDSAISENLLAQ